MNLRTLAEAADQRADAVTLPWRFRSTVPMDGERDFIAAANPTVVLALLDIRDAARLLMEMHEQLGPGFIPHDEIEVRATLARYEEVSRG